MAPRPRAILRLVDANANRALEGLRVCEDIVRFYVESPQLFRRLRALRHAIGATVRRLPAGASALAQARESRRDLGRRTSSSSVAALETLLVINFQRAKEALRVLEECSRLLDLRSSSSFQRLRFQTYEAERDTLRRLAAVRHH